MMFERILVALDTSTSNTSVFETALSLARMADARLMLAHVLPCQDPTQEQNESTPFDAPSTQSERLLSAEEQHRCEMQGLAMLREFHAISTTAGIGTDLAQPLANPGHQICDLAIGWGADLIVIGRRGLTEADELNQGSVSYYVTRHAPCPVLIVQHHLLGGLDRYLSQSSQTAVAR